MEAAGESDPRERFLAAYLAALRGAGAVIAALDPGEPRRGSRSAWVLLTKAAPEFVMWADYFADHSSTRAALEAESAGWWAPTAVRFFTRVGAFLHDVEDLIGDESRLPGVRSLHHPNPSGFYYRRVSFNLARYG